MNFKELHNHSEPLLIGNVWDVSSTKKFQELNYQAVGTSSAAVASMLGYEDNGSMPFKELLWIVKRIAQATSLYLSVDLENGYANTPQELVDNIQNLIDLGVNGINIEDSIVKEKRKLIAPEQFAEKLQNISRYLSRTKQSLFVNARTDAFLLGRENALNETKQRISLYEKNGADGIFVPGITAEKDIAAIVQHTHLPVNVMCMPELPPFQTLKNLRVKRISMGNFLHQNIYDKLGENIQAILKYKSFNPIFDYASK